MSDQTDALVKLAGHPVLDKVAEPLAGAVRRAYQRSGPVGQRAKNFAHGTWLGHPLHPVLTDIPIGAWTAAMALDLAANGDAGLRRAARMTIGVGLLGAAGAAIAGLTDWSETDGRSRRAGLVHGLLNVTAATLFAVSYAVRGGEDARRGRLASWAGYAIAMGSAYLGGHLVYAQRIGVTHAAVDEPESFTEVARGSAVADGAMARARAEDVDVLLARQGGRLCALAHPCSHMGGPLSQGTLGEGSVVCPWHGSEFSLEDGRVLNGPATQPQPRFDVRERDGAIEVKTPGEP